MNRTARKIRIAVLSKPLDNWTSGSGHHLDEMMRHILDLGDEGLDFTFVHYAQSKNPIYSRVRELIVPRNPLRSSRIVAKERFDIVHYAPLSAFAPIWGVRSKKTATVHGIEERLFPQGYSWVQRFHEYYIHPWYMRRMDGIATVSETSRRYFIDHYRAKPERVFITANGISPAYRVLPDRQEPPRPFILHISRYSERKNPKTIMRAFARFSREVGGTHDLVCAGKGWDGDEAKSLARAEGIADLYKAPGFISEDDAVRLLNEARAFVFPSFAEGFGMPNLEAMASGCPVITSSIFAIPEVVGDAAILLSRPDAVEELAEGLLRLERDDSLRATLIERGLARSKAFSWEESAKRLVAYWKSLV